MKKMIALLIAATALSATAAYVWSGFGKVLTASTTPATYTIPSEGYAYSASVYNSGSETVYVTLQTSTNSFVATNAIPVPAGLSYAFGTDEDEKRNRQITAITYATTNGTSDIFCAFK